MSDVRFVAVGLRSLMRCPRAYGPLPTPGSSITRLHDIQRAEQEGLEAMFSVNFLGRLFVVENCPLEQSEDRYGWPPRPTH